MDKDTYAHHISHSRQPLGHKYHCWANNSHERRLKMGSRPHLGPAGFLSRQVMNLECRGRHVCLEPSGVKGSLKCPERRSRCCGRECSIARVCAQEGRLTSALEVYGYLCRASCVKDSTVSRWWHLWQGIEESRRRVYGRGRNHPVTWELGISPSVRGDSEL